MTTSTAPTFGRTHRVLTVAWALLIVIGVFFLFAAISDLASDARVGLPADHSAAFKSLAGVSWDSARRSSSGEAKYITLLEVAYAVHELVFGILFLAIVIIPFHHRARWAWWVCWAVLLANITYTLTFGAYDSTIFLRSLIGLIGIPALLVIHFPAFFGKRARQHAPVTDQPTG